MDFSTKTNLSQIVPKVLTNIGKSVILLVSKVTKVTNGIKSDRKGSKDNVFIRLL